MESVRTRDATNDTEREQLECPDRWAMTRSLSRSRRPPPTDRPTDRPTVLHSDFGHQWAVKYDQNIYAPAAIMSRGTREKHKKKKKPRNLDVQWTMGPRGRGFVTYLLTKCVCVFGLWLYFFVRHRKLFFTIRSSEVQRNCNKHSNLICFDWWMDGWTKPARNAQIVSTRPKCNYV